MKQIEKKRGKIQKIFIKKKQKMWIFFAYCMCTQNIL